MSEIRALEGHEQTAIAGMTFPAYRPLLGTSGAVVVAAYAGMVPIGAAIASLGGMAEALSIYVAPSQRGQGLAARLLTALEDALRRHGVEAVQATYVAGKPTTPQLEATLDRCGWDAPVIRMLVFKADLARMAGAGWVERAELGPEFEFVPWEPGTRPQGDWWPDDLDPARHEADMDLATSRGLRLDGELVGWVINHRIDAVTLRVSAGYVRPDLQMRGRMLGLYAEAGRLASEQGIERLTWTVPIWHPAKAAFARRWMAPFADMQESRGTGKQLST
ncbi:MAG: GCN5-related N-acetyltransferase [Cyanobacteria bacterium RYN_339]|nr:GCN5-related N-acetyltransferase [Cyanobacteria bacterium RYN_339]